MAAREKSRPLPIRPSSRLSRQTGMSLVAKAAFTFKGAALMT
jgi:hypothetical protein